MASHNVSMDNTLYNIILRVNSYKLMDQIRKFNPSSYKGRGPCHNVEIHKTYFSTMMTMNGLS